MIPNFIEILKNELDEKSIVYSPSEKYDFQININKMENSDLSIFMEKINTNDKINTIFDVEQITVGKGKFLCFSIKKNIMLTIMQECNSSNKIFTTNNKNPKTIIYDYSSPNMSKDMHVGHLRSTIIGDTLANISEYFGNVVIRLNHLGDFGLPFGMIVEYIISICGGHVDDNLQQTYTNAKTLFDKNENFANNAYKRTNLLQNKTDDETNNVWQKVLDKSLGQYANIYKLLNISLNLTPKGESFYVDYIEECKVMLENNNLIEIDKEGRICVKCEAPLNPLTYMKSKQKECAYTYDTTDIVALWYRICVMKADEIYYVVDNRQTEHFKQIFNVAKQMGWLNDKNKAEHIQFGTILGKDGKPLKSRNGDTPKLLDLIEESIEKTKEQFKLKNKSIDEFKYEINALAIGSLKYQDYLKARTSDYKFDTDQMLKFDGSTYTFLSYTIARIRGIIDNLKKNNLLEILNNYKIDPNELIEIDYKVIKKIMYFTQIITNVEETKMIHGYIEFLFKLCVAFNSNYTNSRYLNFDKDKNLIGCNFSKLAMCKVLLNILTVSCDLLGLQIINEM